MMARSLALLAAWLVAACGAGQTTVVTAPSSPGGSAHQTATAATTASALAPASPTPAEVPPGPTPQPTEPPIGAFTLTSSAFDDGASIPARFTCDGKDVSPPLAWSGAPSGTAAFLLVMRDPDAGGFLHWMAWNLPADLGRLPAAASGDLPGNADEARSDFSGSRRGYRGPCPPSGRHDYVFTLYALPIALADASTTPPDRLEKGAREIALGEAVLRGTYRRH